jgi:hypothetical protein
MRDLTGEFTKKYDDEVIKGAAFILLILSMPLLVFVGAIVQAYVISMLWGWYIVPFFGAKHLPLVFAFGICLLFQYLCPVNHPTDERKLSEKLSYAMARPLLALLFGYIGTFFI